MSQQFSSQSAREAGALAKCNVTGELFDGRQAKLQIRTASGARFGCPTGSHSHAIFTNGSRVGYEIVR